MKPTLIPFLVAAFTVAASAQTTVDFNSTGHLELNFSTATEGALFTQAADGGLAGSGAVAVPEFADNQFWALDAPFAGNTDHTVSVYVHSADVLNAGYVSFGMMSDPSQTGVVQPSSDDFLGVSINLDSGEFEISGEGAFNETGGTFNTAISTDSWYFFELTYDWQFNQTYGLQFRAYASDANGNLGASLITGDVFGGGLESDVADDASAYSYFGGALTDNVITHFDSFSTSAVTADLSAVPEPSTYAAMAGMVVLGWTAWRRRRQTVA